jgi:hypothetical protein
VIGFRFFFFGYGDSSLEISSIADGGLLAFIGRPSFSSSVSLESLELPSPPDEYIKTSLLLSRFASMWESERLCKDLDFLTL